MKILVVYRAIHNTAGGVERMSSLIMNEMVKRGHSVDYITLDKPDAVSFYPLNKNIFWHKLSLGNPEETANFKTRLNRIATMRKHLKKFRPDVVLAFQEASYLSIRLAALGLGIPVVAAERNSPSRFNFMPSGKRNLAFQSFRFAKFITIQCEAFRRYYPKHLHTKIRTIPNPVFPVELSSKPREKIVLSAGRFGYQKNFPVLIEAFAKIAAQFPEWTLKIIGEGERDSLQKQILAMQLEDRVFLPGALKDLKPDYETASIFCLPSRWEGFPNALAEALSYGLPGTGFADCDGVNELIKHNKNGLLAEGNDNSDSLAEALACLMADKKLRDGMSEAAFQSVKEYDASSIFDRWEHLLGEAAGE